MEDDAVPVYVKLKLIRSYGPGSHDLTHCETYKINLDLIFYTKHYRAAWSLKGKEFEVMANISLILFVTVLTVPSVLMSKVSSKWY